MRCVGASAIALLVFAASTALAQTPPGTLISNQASAAYVGASGSSELALSNRVDLTTVDYSTPSTLLLTRVVGGSAAYLEPVGPAACVAGGNVIALGDPVLIGGAAIDPLQTHSLVTSASYHGGEPVFIRLADPDQNLNPTQAEFLDVAVESPATGDREQIRLTETGPSSGVFSGFVPSAAAAAQSEDCVLQVSRHSSVRVSYTDPNDGTDQSAAVALLDPLSRVFDAETGQAVDGAQVTLVDAVTGQPASVWGDDGVSAFPATLTSGGTVSDGSGTRYSFASGTFRFPVVQPGRYRLEVQPPQGHAAPSSRPEAELQTLPGAPYQLGPGAFGQAFDVDPGPVLAIDLPLDPMVGALFLEKRTAATDAAPGDFVEYQLTLTHGRAAGNAQSVLITDQLPVGFRYVSGSTRVDGAASPDPFIDDDGRGLRFELADLQPGTGVTLRYVTSVVPGTQSGEATNVARASALGSSSNEARAAILIREDLFRTEALLVGRVAFGECSQPDLDESMGLAGARVYLEDGRFAVTDEGGRFHFEGLPSGAHVLQLDLESLPGGVEAAPCDVDPRFAGSPFSRFVELRAGALARADFHVRLPAPPSSEVSLSLSQAVGVDTLAYTLRLSGEGSKAEHIQAMVMLPPGVVAMPESAHAKIPMRVRDSVLTFDVGDRQGAWQETLRFETLLTGDAQGDLVTRALARFAFEGEAAQTPIAETRAFMSPGTEVTETLVLRLNFESLSATLSADDRAELDAVAARWAGIRNIRLEAAGHSDNVPIAPRSRHLYADNQTLSAARARSVADYLGAALALTADERRVQGFGATRPIADNASPEGRRANRRVEVTITGVRNDTAREFRALRDASGVQQVVVHGEALLAHETLSPRVDETDVAAAASDSPAFRLDQVAPGLKWLWPSLEHAPPIPSVRVVIQHAPSQQVELELNGKRVSPLSFEGMETDGAVALSRWRGLDLLDGPNLLKATVRSEDGPATVLERALHFAGPPVRGELNLEASRLVADGQERPVLAVRFVDRWGRPARRGTVGGFNVEGPYRAWWEVERLRENPLLASGERAPTYRVGANGVARIELEPTTRSGEVLLRLVYPQDREQEIRAWLKPGAWDWILVGLAEGTVGHHALSGAMELASASGFDEDYYEEGRMAFFAKGRIKGSTLLTLALDSEGDRDEASGALGGVIDPDRYYTLYGDNTEQRFDAPSREKLYLKIEREAFVALFGDYDTGLTVTELGRYNRSFNGVKSEYHGERVSYSLFASRTDQAFIKDELRGDGTSGPYRLTRAPILANSDKVVVEVRDRFRPERVLASRSLQRHFDYDIDGFSGILYFKEPVMSRDLDFNPIVIVVDYESRDDRDTATIAGGRTAVRFGGSTSRPVRSGVNHESSYPAELGFTLIHEGTRGGDGTLAAADLTYQFNEATELKAELGASDVLDPRSGDRKANAYLMEVTHQRGQVDVQGYLREQDSGFGLGQQRGNEPGTRRGGVDVRAQINPAWLVNSEVFRQESLDDGNRRTVVEGEGRYQDQRRTANMGVRRVSEDLSGQQSDSSQAFLGGTWRFFDQLLTARMNLETEVSGGSPSVDYPTRTVAGLDVAINERVTVFGEYEISDGDRLDTQMTRIGVRANPMDRTQIDTSVNHIMTEYGPRTFANLGLIQGWQVGERWTLDVGLDHANTIREPGLAPFDPEVPLASGSLDEDFSSLFLGVGYRSALWSFTSRLEHRNSDREERSGLVTGFYREPEAGRGFSAEVRLLDTLSAAGFDTFDGMLRLGWAYRPAGGRWIVFDRVDWIGQHRADLGDDIRSQRLVNNLNAHFMPDFRQELELQYAAKYVRSNFDGFTATGFLDLLGFEWRRRLTPRFDVGVHGSWYRAHEFNVVERGWGVDVGMNVANNLLVSVGYNLSGFQDEDFSRARYTAKGPFVRFRLKVDQASLKQLLRR